MGNSCFQYAKPPGVDGSSGGSSGVNMLKVNQQDGQLRNTQKNTSSNNILYNTFKNSRFHSSLQSRLSQKPLQIKTAAEVELQHQVPKNCAVIGAYEEITMIDMVAFNKGLAFWRADLPKRGIVLAKVYNPNSNVNNHDGRSTVSTRSMRSVKSTNQNTQNNVFTPEEILERELLFQNELNIISQIEHPNVLSFYGYQEGVVSETEMERRLFFEFTVDSLGAHISHRTMNGRTEMHYYEANLYALQIMKGLHFLHSKHILHRNLNSENIVMQVRPLDSRYKEFLKRVGLKESYLMARLSSSNSSSKLSSSRNSKLSSFRASFNFMSKTDSIRPNYKSSRDLANVNSRYVDGEDAEDNFDDFDIFNANNSKKLEEELKHFKARNKQNGGSIYKYLDGYPMTAKICNFGEAKVLEPNYETGELGRTKTQTGSIQFMCPEMYKNDLYDDSADIWSFGCILFHMITGKIPFHKKNVYSYIESKVTSGKFPRNERLAPNKQFEPLENILRKCLKTEPGLRPTASELDNDLHKIQ